MIIRTNNFEPIENLSTNSAKKIWYTCRICGCGYLIRYDNYVKKIIPDLCFGCRYKDDEFKQMISDKVSKSKIGVKKSFNTRKSPYYYKLKEEMEKDGYELLTTHEDYIKGDAWVNSLCKNKHNFSTTYKLFITQGYRCNKCKEEERLDRVLKLCNDKNYQFISIDKRHINFICDKGHECKTLLCNFYKDINCLKCSLQEKSSLPEKEIVEYLKSLGIENIITSDRSVINPYELDIYLPDYNIAIEYNGKWFHDEFYKDKNYHLMKTELCNDKDIFLIHIFDDEWEFKKDIVKHRLKHLLNLNKERVYARKCIIKEISPKTARDFCNIYHIQGYGSSKIKLGLYYNDDLVSVMTFSMLNISKGSVNIDNIWELNRFCSSINVIGGASKLLTYFKRNYEWDKIISYADRRWSKGSLYYKIGFKFIGYTLPNYWYWDRKKRDITRYHRFNFRKNKIKHLGNGTEIEIMNSIGWSRIWDCGNYKFELINE